MFYFFHSIHSKIKLFKYCFVFISLIFILHILILFSSQPFPGAMSWRSINTENSFIRRSNLKECKPLFWISASVSDIFKAYMKQDKQSFCATLARREKDGTQPIIPYMVYLIKTDMISSENSDTLALVSAKLNCQALFRVVSDLTKVDLHHAVATKNSDSKKSLIQLYIFFIMKIKEVF